MAGGLDDDRLQVGVAVRGPARNAGDTDAVPVFDKPGSFFPQLHFRPPNASIVTSSFSIDPPIPILLLLPPSLSLSVFDVQHAFGQPTMYVVIFGRALFSKQDSCMQFFTIKIKFVVIIKFLPQQKRDSETLNV